MSAGRFLRALLFLWLLAPLGVRAQEEPPPLILQPETPEAPEVDEDAEFRRHLDVLLRAGRSSEAITLLEGRSAVQGLDRMLERRLVRLYRDVERHADAEKLLRERLARPGGEGDAGDLRLLAETLLDQSRTDEGLQVLRELLQTHPDDPAYYRLVSNVLSHHRLYDEAIAILEEGRGQLADPSEFAQFLGQLYAESDRRVDAVREYLRVIVESPLNLSLMRAQIMELAADGRQLDEMVAAAEALHVEHPQTPQLALVLAELRQRAGDADGAWLLVEPLLDDPSLLQDVVQMAMAALADSRLPDVPPQRGLAQLDLAARVLRGLLLGDRLPRSFQPRVYETLSRTHLAMLENEAFLGLDGAEQERLLDQARRAILEMGERFPANRLSSTALLRLAGIYVDRLHRPSWAVELYEHLLVSPNAPREQVYLARVGLGRAHVAAGDTLAARELFTHMVRDRRFPEGRGRAHYHLGLLDFMGGGFETAQDRLSSVALEAPQAEYTNDALDLAMILAEQAMVPIRAPGGLEAYGRALYFKATQRPDSLRAALASILDGPPSELRQRARLDLARLHRSAGETTRAVDQLRALVREGPASRYAPGALELWGELLEESGDAEGAREIYERLLLEYDDYVFLDGVRDRIRSLQPESDGEGELP